MIIFFKGVVYIIFFIILTIVTQIGGLALIIVFPLFLYIKKKFNKPIWNIGIRVLSFIAVYLFISIAIVPVIAQKFGRVPLPVFSNSNVKPLNIMTCLLNRHYVKPTLKKCIQEVGEKMSENYKNAVVSYMDANFPFIDNFPLIPHLSHSDGKKLDIAFFYTDKNTNSKLNNIAPSFIGYGVFEDPKKGEHDMPAICAKKGYWQYGYMEKVIPQWNKKSMDFDEIRTKKMIQLFTSNSDVGKIFIEPHLKNRMQLTNNKIRFHGCRAVRHDDHIHVQLK